MATRFAMLARQLLPRLQQAWQVKDQSVAGLDHAALRAVIAQKNAASREIAAFEPLLWPEGD